VTDRVAAAHPPVAWRRIVEAAPPLDLPIAVGGGLDPVSLLAAYRHGAFPFPNDEASAAAVNCVLYEADVARGDIACLSDRAPLGPFSLTWWHPPRRPVIHRGTVHLSRRLKQELRNRHAWTTRCDTAYERALTECRARRRQRWMTDELCRALLDLHRDGWAHSIEIWDGTELVGGLIGVAVGTVFSMDSAFSRRPNAAKVAVADLDRRLGGTPARLLDVQIPSAYTTALGGVTMSRAEYLAEVLVSHQRLVPRHGELDVRSLAARAERA